jgi:hypothetical protein
MAYIGKNPTSVPLTSSDITDGIITTTKIADANVTNPKLTSGSQQNFRNIIINGDMSIAQRGTSTSGVTSDGYYTIDRMYFGVGTAGTWTQSQSTDVPTGQGFANSLKMDCTTANGSLSAGSNLRFQHKIEGQNLQYLKKGTSNAESTTLSFWVYATKTGTNICELYDTDNSRQISKSYTINSSNTWEKKTITFAGDTSGAFGNDNGGSLTLLFWLAAGSTFSSGSLSNSWTSAVNADRAVGQVNHADSTSNEWYITGVQLEAGTTASDFEFLPHDVNLNRCQRYFQFRGGASNAAIAPGMSTATNVGCFAIPYFSTMRSAPSLSFSSVKATDNTNYDSNVSSIAAIQSSNTSTRVFFNTASTNMTQYRPAFLDVLGSATSSGITLSAEL